MIVLGERQNDTNVLHVIFGPETDFQFNLSGQSVIDITEYITNYKPSDKCVLVVNKCNSEEELIQMLHMHQARMKAMNLMGQVANQLGQNEAPTDPKNKKEELKRNNKGIKCPKCGCPDSAMIIDGTVYPCVSCQKIDKGLQDGTVPPIPEIERLEEIRKKVETVVPQQKKSIFQFYGENPDTNQTDHPKKKKK